MMKLKDFIKLIDIENLKIFLNSFFIFICRSDSPVLDFYKENEIEEIGVDYKDNSIKIFLKK